MGPEQKSQIDVPLGCVPVGPAFSPKHNGKLPEGANCVANQGSYNTFCCDDGLACTSAASRHTKKCGTTFWGEQCSCTPYSEGVAVNTVNASAGALRLKEQKSEIDVPLDCYPVGP